MSLLLARFSLGQFLCAVAVAPFFIFLAYLAFTSYFEPKVEPRRLVVFGRPDHVTGANVRVYRVSFGSNTHEYFDYSPYGSLERVIQSSPGMERSYYGECARPRVSFLPSQATTPQMEATFQEILTYLDERPGGVERIFRGRTAPGAYKNIELPDDVLVELK
jgi:hypothetical protein